MPTPGSARTAEEFVRQLRQARTQSELTLWELEQRAEAAGHRLDPATLVRALDSAELPDEDLVAALLAACGRTGDQTAQWLSARARIAGDPRPPSATPPDTGPRHPRHPRPPDAPAASTAPAQPAAPDPRSAVDTPTQTVATLAPVPAPPSVALEEATVLTPVLPGPRPAPAPAAPQPGGRGPLWRPLATAVAITLVGVASVAVIISAVNDGEAAGPPVYAPGAPQQSQPTEPSPAPTPTDIASPTPSPSRPAAASPRPQPGVLRSGTATLLSGQGIDLDGGGSEPDITASGGNSLRADSRRIAAEPTASRQACAAATAYQRSLQDLAPGRGICVRTDKGRYAHLTVTRTGPLTFSYVVWS